MATGTGRRRARLGAPRLFPGSPRRRRAIRPAAPAAPFPKEPRSRRRWIAAPARRRCYGRSARSGARSRSPPPCCSSAVSAVWYSACRSGPALRHRRSNLRNGPSRRFQLSPRRRAHRPPRRPPIPVREGCPRRRSLGRDRMRGLRQRCRQCPLRALAPAQRPATSKRCGRPWRWNRRGSNRWHGKDRRKKRGLPKSRSRPRSASRRPIAKSWRGAKPPSPPYRA